MVYNSLIKMYEVIVSIFDRLPFPPLNPSQQISNHTVLLMFLFKRLSLVEKCPPPPFFLKCVMVFISHLSTEGSI